MKRCMVISGLTALALTTAVGRATPPTAVPAPPAPLPNWYNVELIVFRDTDPNAGSLETWPTDPGTPDWNGSLAFNTMDSIPPVPFQALPPTSEQLGDEWTRLKRSKNYEPLLHVTWTQPALDRSMAQAVRIGAPPAAAPASTSRPLPAATAGGGNALPLPTPAYGTARLSTTGPYLHFDLDLVLEGPLARNSSPAASTAASNTTLLTPPGATLTPPPTYQLYRLQQDRRVDGGKLTYFDHPLFGAILLVTPVRHSAAPLTTP